MRLFFYFFIKCMNVMRVHKWARDSIWSFLFNSSFLNENAHANEPDCKNTYINGWYSFFILEWECMYKCIKVYETLFFHFWPWMYVWKFNCWFFILEYVDKCMRLNFSILLFFFFFTFRINGFLWHRWIHQNFVLEKEECCKSWCYC